MIANKSKITILLTVSCLILCAVASYSFASSLYSNAVRRAIHDAPERVSEYAQLFHVDFQY